MTDCPLCLSGGMNNQYHCLLECPHAAASYLRGTMITRLRGALATKPGAVYAGANFLNNRLAWALDPETPHMHRMDFLLGRSLAADLQVPVKLALRALDWFTIASSPCGVPSWNLPSLPGAYAAPSPTSTLKRNPVRGQPSLPLRSTSGGLRATLSRPRGHS